MSRIAIYPGTFDPLTLGHEDLIKRAITLFDHVIIAVTNNADKKTLFSLKERTQLIEKVFSKNPKVSVESFYGLLVDFAKAKKTNIILRGLRVVTDFDYEFQLAGINRKLAPKIETVFLMPGNRYEYVSSSVVRVVAEAKGDISHFVSPVVSRALKRKFS